MERGEARVRIAERISIDSGRLGCLEGFLEEAVLSWVLKKRIF